MTSITPFLWFDGDLAEPIEFYTSVFDDGRLVDAQRMGDDGPVFGATIELAGQRLSMLNGGPVHAGFTESISMFISVDTQAEVDLFWARLIDGGGEAGSCGWLKDRYGLSWQVVPTMLGRVLGGSDPARCQQAQTAMLGMGKLDIAALQAAYDR